MCAEGCRRHRAAWQCHAVAAGGGRGAVLFDVKSSDEVPLGREVLELDRLCRRVGFPEHLHSCTTHTDAARAHDHAHPVQPASGMQRGRERAVRDDGDDNEHAA